MHVITGLETGGAEMMLWKLLSASNGRHQHVVVSLANQGTMGERIRGLGVPVYTLGLRAGAPNPLRAFAIRSLTREIDPQLIQGWMAHGNLAASLAARWGQNRPPVIWGIHQSLHDLGAVRWLTALVIRFNARLSSGVAGIIYVSRTSRMHHEALGYDPRHGLVIPNGLDCRAFAPDERERCKVRTDLGIPENAVLVGLVARYHPLKDQ